MLKIIYFIIVINCNFEILTKMRVLKVLTENTTLWFYLFCSFEGQFDFTVDRKCDLMNFVEKCDLRF